MNLRGGLSRLFRRAGGEHASAPLYAFSPEPNSNRAALKHAWDLAKPYWGTKEGRKSLPGVAGIVTTAAAKVGLAALNVVWWGGFVDAAMQKNIPQITFYLGLYGVLAASEALADGWYFGSRQKVKMQWREHMHREWTEKWLNDGNKAYYHMLSSHEGIDNPDHRLTEDIKWFVDDAVELSSEGLTNAMQLGAFTGMLWALSGTWNVAMAGQDFSIHGGLVWATLLVAGLGLWYTQKKGRPLSALYNTERNAEGDQRTQLVRVRQNAESIAMMSGEKVERAIVENAVGNIARTWNRIVDRQAGIRRFTTGHDRLSKLVPYLAVSSYFTGDITWGKVMQAAYAGEKVQSSFNWTLVSVPQFYRWKTFTQRIVDLGKAIEDTAMDRSKETFVVTRDNENNTVTLKDITVNRPKGTGTLLEDVSLTLNPGDRLIMTGPSGSGKTTFLRVVTGLYRSGHGEVKLPENTFFIPQKPYLPNIPLRGILSYPQSAGTYSDERMKEALTDAGLPRLIPLLEQEHLRSDHFATLSGGEQQRLRLASVLLHEPELLMIDEGTSSLDEDSSRYFYDILVKKLREKLPRTIMWSIAHQKNLIPFHNLHGTLQNKTIDIMPVPLAPRL